MPQDERSSARACARYNVRLLLTSSAEALRDEVMQLRIPPHQLSLMATHATVEALAMQDLSPVQVAALERVVEEAGGALLTDAARRRAVLVTPLAVAGELRARLSTGGAETAELGDAIGDALVAGGTAPPPLIARGHRLEFGRRTLTMGVVNVTPDSFAGDGLDRDVAAAIAQAARMAEAGADIIDVGGESTRPNSTAVDAAEELARVMPVVEALAGSLHVPVSIDSRKAEVARAALDAGAAIVNDVWGLRGDPEMAAVVAQHPDVAVVVMHNQLGVEYENLVADVSAALRHSLALAADAGVARERIVVDPGFGFAKTPAQNLELLRRMRELRGIGRPVLSGLSRKSTIGFLTGGAPPDDRLEGSLALAVLAVAAGADIVRTHDVAQTVRALQVADAVVRGTPEAVLALPAPGPTG